MGKDSPDPPPAAAVSAGQQQQFNQADYRFQVNANNPNSYSPVGSVTYSGSPGSPGYAQHTTLNPTLNTALNSQQNVLKDRSGIAEGLTGRVATDLADPVNYDGFQDYGQVGDYNERRQTAEDASYDRATSRLDPQWEQAQQKMEVQLGNQGLVPGDEAYDDAMANLLRGKNDAYAGATNDAIGIGREESNLAYNQNLGTADYDNSLRNQQINETLQKRGWSINEINSLLNGTNIGLPSSNTYNASGGIGKTDVLGSQQLAYQGNLDRYNAGQQQNQGLFGGITDVAGMFF